MITLKYVDWLTLAGISLEALEQMMDLFDEADLSVSEIRTLGKSLGTSVRVAEYADYQTIVDKMPHWFLFLQSNQIEDDERLKLLGDLIVELANHEDGKIDV